MNGFLICYDITDSRRLGRLHRYLKKHAMPLQNSVFLFKGDDRQLDMLLQTASAIIDHKSDDLRAYPVPNRGGRYRLGKPLWPEGIQFGSPPYPW